MYPFHVRTGFKFRKSTHETSSSCLSKNTTPEISSQRSYDIVYVAACFSIEFTLCIYEWLTYSNYSKVQTFRLFLVLPWNWTKPVSETCFTLDLQIFHNSKHSGEPVGWTSRTISNEWYSFLSLDYLSCWSIVSVYWNTFWVYGNCRTFVILPLWGKHFPRLFCPIIIQRGES